MMSHEVKYDSMIMIINVGRDIIKNEFLCSVKKSYTFKTFNRNFFPMGV